MKKTAVFAFVAASALFAAACGKEPEVQPQTSQPSESTATHSTSTVAGTQEETTAAAETHTETTEGESISGEYVPKTFQAGDFIAVTKQDVQVYTTADGIPAFTLKVEYPVFEGDSQVITQINDFFEEWMQDRKEYYSEEGQESVQAAIEMKEIGEDMPDSEDDYTVESVVAHDGILSVFTSSYLYEGGAHGMPSRSNYMLDTATGKELSLLKVVNLDEKALNDKVRVLFEERIKNDTEGMFFEEALLTLAEKDDFAENYYLSEDGVVFYTQPYEIAPYAAGFVEVTVPYAELGM